MSTFWLKIAAVVVAVVVAIIVISAIMPSGSKPEHKEKTFYETAEQDRQKFRIEPKPEPPVPAQNTTAPVVPGGNESTRQPAPPQFEELPFEEKVQAEKLLEMAIFHRSSGRLPVLTYKKMVDYCREIIRNWPKSEYAYKAKLMLRDMPEQYREMYNITAEEIGS